jgi:hypothetical protein
MATAIATIGNFTGLSTVGTGFRWSDAAQVKIPGGGVTKWSWSTILGDQVVNEIVGVIVALSEVQHDLWPHQGQASEKSSPYMRSHDGRTAFIVGEDSGDLNLKEIEAAKIEGTKGYDCSKLSYFQWEKTADGRNIPPRANATSVVGILRAGESAPLFIRLSKTSSPKVQEYSRQLRMSGVQPYQVVTSLGLEKIAGPKASYSRVVPKFVERAPEEMFAAFREYFDSVSPQLRGSLDKYVPKENSTDAVPF